MKRVNKCEQCKLFYPVNRVEEVEIENELKEGSTEHKTIWLCKNCIKKVFTQEEKKIKKVK